MLVNTMKFIMLTLLATFHVVAGLRIENLSQIQGNVSGAVALAKAANSQAPPNFRATEGVSIQKAATLGNVCTSDFYQPSVLETQFHNNALAWTHDKATLCAKLQPFTAEWLNSGSEVASSRIFSRKCTKGKQEEVIEPLAGILRDPRVFCAPGDYIYSISWLLLANAQVMNLQPGSKRLMFDAGGSQFEDAMAFFTRSYRNRGILFDHVYVWEAVPQDAETYWIRVPAQVRAFWEPRVTFYNGVPVSATPGDPANVAEKIFSMCAPKDFCAFKLDIDTPLVERQILASLLDQPQKTAASLDEFFYEEHVHGLMQPGRWRDNVHGTFLDSYNAFAELRKLGVRAHSWI